MNNLLPFVASSRPLGFLGRLFLLLALILSVGLLFWKLSRFISLFSVEIVATPSLPMLN